MRAEDDNGDRKSFQILLKGQISVYRHENVEVLRCKIQQRSIRRETLSRY